MDASESFLSRHRRIIFGAAVVLVGVAALVVFWFQPQKLFLDDEVNEALPQVSAVTSSTRQAVTEPSTDPMSTTTAPATRDPRPLFTGGFRSLEHTTTGQATVLELPSGERFLRFENFETSNGPDLRVYLSAAPAGGPDGAFDDDYVELGRLKGNVGNQNYEIPRGTDLEKYRSAVVWCRRFSVGFAVAPLA